jgi:glucose/arabinose dehydrogenase
MPWLFRHCIGLISIFPLTSARLTVQNRYISIRLCDKIKVQTVHQRNSFCLLFLLWISIACGKKEAIPPGPEPEIPPKPPVIETATILSGYEVIWGMDFLPSGDMLFTEKRGKLYRYANGTVSEITGFPSVRSAGQGGLLDIRVHPNHNTNGWVYAAYSATSPENNGELRLVRFRLSANAVQGLETIFTTGGGNTWNGHYGARIVFDKTGLLWLGVGEGGTGSYGGPTASNLNSSNPASAWGKIHRMTDAGAVPADNPVLPGQTTRTTAYALGIRNPQGMALHPSTGELWENEHGPKGGDEINIIMKAADYGWPRYSLGRNYDDAVISQGHTASGITAPIHSWTPSIGVCGMAFIAANAFGTWKGNLLCGGLASQKLYRCTFNGSSLVSIETVDGISGRVRNVIQGTDGSVYVSLENPGRILRITAK